MDAPGTFDFANPAFRADPYPAYRFLREAAPLFRLPTGQWIVSTHAACTSVLRDNRFGHKNYSKVIPDFENEPAIAALSRMMLLRDPPEHTRLRGLVSKAFTARRMEALRPRIEEIVDELIDAVISNGGMDVIRDFAHKLPVTVICDMLGIPEQDRAPFLAESNVRGRILDPVPMSREELDQANEGQLKSQAYFTTLFAYRRANPGDDLTTALLLARENDDALTDLEALANIGLLFGAGHETTTNLIASGFLTLLRQPAAFEQLRTHPEIVASAVEELLRFEAPVQHTARIAPADMQLAGKTIQKGSRVVAGLAAANRDPQRFPDPDRLDLLRPDNRHLAFGWAAHFCFGAPLARMEGQIAFNTIMRRLAHPVLLDAKLEWRENAGLRGLTSLRIGFDPASPEACA